MDALASLPSRCCFGVVDGLRGLQIAPSAYMCYHGVTSVGGVVITNGAQQLHEVYKQAQKRNVAKRQLKPLEDRANKRQHLVHSAADDAAGDGGLDAALAAVAGKQAAQMTVLPPKQQQQAHPGPVAGAAECHQQQLLFAAINASKQASAALQAAPSTQSASCSKSSKQLFTVEQLKLKTNKELVDLLRARSCPVSGQKAELIRRLLDYQRRLKKAQGAA